MFFRFLSLLLCIPSACHLFCRNVDDVHDIMDDLQEQNEIAEEIASAISQPIGFATEYDDVSTTSVCILKSD